MNLYLFLIFAESVKFAFHIFIFMYNLIFSVWKENVKLGKFYDYSDFELHGTSSDFIK